MNGNTLTLVSRRRVLGAGALAAAAALAAGPASLAAGAQNDSFSFLLLGDLHFDRLEHHDMEWLKREKPNDVRQVENYSRITREVTPALFAELRARVRSERDTAFALHIGDFVEGLAGTPELARVHCKDAVAFLRDAKLERPFLFCKGNHDVTGPGSVEAFNEVLLPYLAGEAGQKLTSASFAYRRGPALIAFLDAYRPVEAELEWLEKTLAARGDARHVFVVVHPPLVPYGARSNWHLLAKPADSARRERLMDLLGEHRALVLCGHLHKYGTVVRSTKKGPFVQVATLSVLPGPDLKPKNEVEGVKQYGPDLVRLEPEFSPQTETERRALLAAEAPHIRHYEYADLPGYGRVTVRPEDVTLDLYVGLGKKHYRTLSLTRLLTAAGG